MENNKYQHLIKEIAWNEQGLVPVIAQEYGSGDVLMMAWMNEAAFIKTLEIGQAVYWSRSRNKLWHKGEESGHFQIIKSIHLDCDGDTLLIKVEQIDGIACHTGAHSCFFRDLENQASSLRWQK